MIELISSLNLNTPPLQNERFVELVNAVGNTLSPQVNKKSTFGTENFEIDFTRYGKLNWLDKSPVYCDLALDIRQNGQSILKKPFLLQSSKLPTDVMSFFEWLDELLKDKENREQAFHQLSGEGEYLLYITNGIGGLNNTKKNTPADEYIHAINKYSLAVDLFKIAMPLAIDLNKVDDNCRQQVIELSNDIANLFLDGIIVPGINGKEDFASVCKPIIDNFRSRFINLMSSCDNYYRNKYLKDVFDGLDKINPYLKIADYTLSLTNMWLRFKDWHLSNIDAEYEVAFYDGVCFDSYQLTLVPDFDQVLSGKTSDKVTASALIKEKRSIFEVYSGNGLQPCEFKVKEFDYLGEGLPFNISIVEGDAIVNALNNRVTADAFGKLNVNLTIGEEDSKIQIKPAFKNSGLDPLSFEIMVKDVDFLTRIVNIWFIKHDAAFKAIINWPSMDLINVETPDTIDIGLVFTEKGILMPMFGEASIVWLNDQTFTIPYQKINSGFCPARYLSGSGYFTDDKTCILQGFTITNVVDNNCQLLSEYDHRLIKNHLKHYT
ncbi:MAG: hypothetical protein HC906_14410 [Bacteroidales bacterium]|nr:hypothetical protein [Bacteroidales bacterium]